MPVKPPKSRKASSIIKPGGVVGILGGGQLGRMTALAAASLGYRSHVFSDEMGSPGTQVASITTVAGYDDRAALEGFALSVDVATCEFENVPAAAIAAITAITPFHPAATVFATCQDRLVEKNFVVAAGVGTAPYRAVDSYDDLVGALSAIGTPAVLKTRRFGYDGKGQARIMRPSGAMAAWIAIDRRPAIVEGFVRFKRELSVVVARGADGSVAAYDAVENIHVDHILDVTLVPARVSARTARRAHEAALALAERLELVGLIAVEMFETEEGGILVNEMAPRPHNSGHWTIEACVVSQFEQHIRAVAGWPLGDPSRHSDAVMENIIGAEVEQWQALSQEKAGLHIYGKRFARPSRKMGHITRLSPLTK